MRRSGDLEDHPKFVRPMKTHNIADYMSLSEDSVLRMVRSGQIPAKRVGNEYYYDPDRLPRFAALPCRPRAEPTDAATLYRSISMGHVDRVPR